MNVKSGKTLVLVGLGGKLVIAVFSLLLRLVVNLYVGSVINMLQLPLTLVIVAGFVMAFLADRNIMDLIIAGGFGVSALTSLISVVTSAAGSSLPAMITLALSFIGTVGLFVWAFKLYRDSNTLAALAVVGSYIVSFGVSFLLTLFTGFAEPSFITSPIYILISGAGSIVSAAALAYAAFMDWQE